MGIIIIIIVLAIAVFFIAIALKPFPTVDGVRIYSLSYHGGIPEIIQNGYEVNITVTSKAVNVENKATPGNKTKIPISSILNASIKTEEQISKDVTFTRLLALGVFAFAFKKTTKQQTTYLVLEYDSGGIHITALFSGVFSDIIYS
jgi:hypothetical protein